MEVKSLPRRWCPVSWCSQSRKEAEAVTASKRGRGHWHGDNQNYFTTQLQMLVTNIFTSLTAPSTQIRAHVSPAVSPGQVMLRCFKGLIESWISDSSSRLICWSSPCVLFLRLILLKVRIVTRKAANFSLKESRLGSTRVFGCRPKVLTPLANIQAPGLAESEL